MALPAGFWICLTLLIFWAVGCFALFPSFTRQINGNRGPIPMPAWYPHWPFPKGSYGFLLAEFMFTLAVVIMILGPPFTDVSVTPKRWFTISVVLTAVVKLWMHFFFVRRVLRNYPFGSWDGISNESKDFLWWVGGLTAVKTLLVPGLAILLTYHVVRSNRLVVESADYSGPMYITGYRVESVEIDCDRKGCWVHDGQPLVAFGSPWACDGSVSCETFVVDSSCESKRDAHDALDCVLGKYSIRDFFGQVNYERDSDKNTWIIDDDSVVLGETKLPFGYFVGDCSKCKALTVYDYEELEHQTDRMRVAGLIFCVSGTALLLLTIAGWAALRKHADRRTRKAAEGETTPIEHVRGGYPPPLKHAANEHSTTEHGDDHLEVGDLYNFHSSLGTQEGKGPEIYTIED